MAEGATEEEPVNPMLLELLLVRAGNSDDATIGLLVFNGLPCLLTLEPPDRGNVPTISCIPEGEYTCSRKRSTKTNGNFTFGVDNVPSRSGILFHWGNTVLDTQGCILLGKRFGAVDFRPAVMDSKHAWVEFMTRLKSVEKFKLRIVRGK